MKTEQMSWKNYGKNATGRVCGAYILPLSSPEAHRPINMYIENTFPSPVCGKVIVVNRDVNSLWWTFLRDEVFETGAEGEKFDDYPFKKSLWFR